MEGIRVLSCSQQRAKMVSRSGSEVVRKTMAISINWTTTAAADRTSRSIINVCSPLIYCCTESLTFRRTKGRNTEHTCKTSSLPRSICHGQKATRDFDLELPSRTLVSHIVCLLRFLCLWVSLSLPSTFFSP